MSLPWNSSFTRRSKSTRRGSSFVSPIGYAITDPPTSPQHFDSYIRISVKGQRNWDLSGKSGIITMPDGRSCMMAAGEFWEAMPNPSRRGSV
jgi:hypothetical protein